MIGANPGCLMITILMIVVPAFLFQFYVLNYVRGNLYPIANGLLAISCLYTLLRAGLSDPGTKLIKSFSSFSLFASWIAITFCLS